MTVVPLSPHETTQIVGIRAMLDRACRLARTVRTVDRATVVVLLDGVVERASHFVAVSRGLKIGRNDGLDELISKLRSDFGAKWNPRVLADIRQMHRARNSAQHEGLAPDRDQFTGWSAATSAYVRSLIDAQFRVDIDRVVLADAIADPKLRGLLTQADHCSSGGDFRRCMELLNEAFRDALARWSWLHSSRPHGPSRHEYPDTELVEEVVELKQAVQVASFAVDPAEYAWFKSASKEPDVWDADDAERAVGFVFWWVVGWEAFEATWVPDRRERSLRERRAVRNAEVPARIASLRDVSEVRFRGADAGDWTLEFELADVPPEDEFDVWRFVVSRSMEQMSPSVRCQIMDDGTAEISGIALGDIESAAKALRAALETAPPQVRDIISSNQAQEEGDRVLITTFRDEITAQLDQLPVWVDRVWLEIEHRGPMGTNINLLLTEDARAKLERDLVHSLLSNHPKVDSCWGSVEADWEFTPISPAAEVVRILRDIDGAITEAIEARTAEIRSRRNVVDEIRRRAVVAGGLI